jgi:hypothetical protein
VDQLIKILGDGQVFEAVHSEITPGRSFRQASSAWPAVAPETRIWPQLLQVLRLHVDDICGDERRRIPSLSPKQDRGDGGGSGGVLRGWILPPEDHHVGGHVDSICSGFDRSGREFGRTPQPFTVGWRNDVRRRRHWSGKSVGRGGSEQTANAF